MDMGNLGKVIACLKELSIKPKVDDFQSKLVIQKAVYLLQSMGVKTGYAFNFYVRGTYSPALTEDMYRNKGMVQSLSHPENLSEREQKLVEEFRTEMGELSPAVLEIAAAYAYFFKEKGMGARDATIRTKEAKPFFSEMQFVKGINRAKALLFKPTAEDLKWLKKETEPWQQASLEALKKF
jgi:hypothetical protein